MADTDASLQWAHCDLLDIIDRLRAQGLNGCVDLTHIIVCGERSSGKSSTIEAISGVAFPANDNLCTRFVTELVLRRTDSEPAVAVSILPGRDRSAIEKA